MVLLQFRVDFGDWNGPEFWFADNYLFSSQLKRLLRILLFLTNGFASLQSLLLECMKIFDKSFDMSGKFVLIHFLLMNLVFHMLLVVTEALFADLAIVWERLRFENHSSEMFGLLLGLSQLCSKCLSKHSACWIFSILLVGFQSSLSSKNRYLFKRRNEEEGQKLGITIYHWKLRNSKVIISLPADRWEVYSNRPYIRTLAKGPEFEQLHLSRLMSLNQLMPLF